MTISINSNVLLNYYQAKAGVPLTTASTSTSSSSTTSTTTASTNPTAPWTTTPTASQTNSLIESVLSGQAFVNPSASKVSVPGASPNYKNLFALYQGLSAL